jgi:hypothetical protein
MLTGKKNTSLGIPQKGAIFQFCNLYKNTDFLMSLSQNLSTVDRSIHMQEVGMKFVQVTYSDPPHEFVFVMYVKS